MRKILLLLMLVFSVAAIGQDRDVVANRVVANRNLYMPVRDTNFTPARIGEIVIRPGDVTVYVAISITAPKKWQVLGSGSDISSLWNKNGNGSTNPATDFFGTTDNNDVRVRINNQYYGRLSKIGTTVYLDSLYPGSLYLGLEAGRKDTTTDASIIRPSIGLGNYALRNYAGASTGQGMIAIGHMALMNWIGDSVTGSGIAIGTRSQVKNIKGFRNTSVGVNSLHNLTLGTRNTAYGFASGEWTSTGSDNSFYGESSARLNTIGVFNSAFGNSAGYANTGAVRFITITEGGTGYSSPPTVTISSPDVTPFGFNPSIQATGTAVLNGDTVVGVTITEIGAGYSSATVSFSGGGGTGATATVTVVGGSLNSAFGSTALYSNRTGYGNVGVGVQTGYGDGTNANDRRVIDSLNTYLGIYATARGANPQSTAINKSTAIGYKAIVSQSNSIVLGATGSDQPNVGIGTTAPDRELDVNGDAIVRDTLTTSSQAQFDGGYNSKTTSIVNNTGVDIPTLNSLLDGAVLKVGTNTSQDASLSMYKARAGNFSGSAITTYRTNSNDLATKAAMLGSQSFFQIVNYGVAGDNSTVNLGAIYRTRAFLTPKATYIPSFHEFQLRDTSGGLFSKFIIRPHVAIFGDNIETTVDDPSVQFRIESTSKGILIPRLTTTQRNAITSPATSLLIFNSDSLKFEFYNSTAWVTIGGSSGGSGSGTVNSGNQYRLAYYATTGTAVSEAAAITANRALISDANGVPTHATTTATEIGYVNGVTSAIQTQIDSKVGTSRTISTTSPLSGGDDLSANRTLAIADAAADGSTKGAASFTAADFNATSGNVSIDYTNGQKATPSQPGFMTAAQAARLDSNTYFQSGEGVEVQTINDSTYRWRIKAFQIWDSDTATTTNATITTASTITCPNDGAGVLTVTMVGVKTDGTKYLTGEKKVQWTSTGGVVTLRYTTEIAADFLTGFTTATWTVDASGGTLRIRVTGEATENVEWSPSYTMKYHSVAL